MWNEISSKEDANNLLELFGYFHDGCIKELKYVSGTFVKPNMNMMPINEKRELCVIFQRQWRDPSVIEIVFSGLSLLHLAPVDENYTSEILDANMEFSEDGVFWIDGDLSEKELHKALDAEGYTWIKAKKAKWRAVEEFIGNDDVFVYAR
ncbi:MAG: hypothetical protein VB095_06240 [Anaerovorax sp.]|nr:hypothetical protein [Anaerovorax sp.]